MLNGGKNGEGSAEQEENNPGIEIQPKSSRKRSSIAQNYPLLSSCTCKMKCIGHVGEIKRNDIHAAFNRKPRWKVIVDSWTNWDKGSPSKAATIQSCINKNVTRIYKFTVNGVGVQVCKTFFLRTLGYKYDTIITKMFKPMTPSKI